MHWRRFFGVSCLPSFSGKAKVLMLLVVSFFLYIIVTFALMADSDLLDKVRTRNTEALQQELDTLKLKVQELEAGKRVYPEVRYLAEKDRRRILVTGGAGFVGSHLIDRLMFAGHEVTVVDNFVTGRKKNIEHWIGHENFEVINHDIINPLFIEVDQIYHLASPASPPMYMYNPIKTIKTNTMGTINMLGLAKRVKARLLLASTSEVYGDPQVHPQPETYWGYVNQIGPRACYDEGKRAAETMCYAYANQEGVEVRVARIFNTYGPRMLMNDGRVVTNFIISALSGEPIYLFGDGSQTRSFQHIDDLVEGLIRLMNSDYSQPVNIGSVMEFTIRDFAEMVIHMTGSNSTIQHKPPVTDDPKMRKPDITVAKQVLGWEPKVSLEEGIAKTIEYFRKELERANKNRQMFTLPPDL